MLAVSAYIALKSGLAIFPYIANRASVRNPSNVV